MTSHRQAFWSLTVACAAGLAALFGVDVAPPVAAKPKPEPPAILTSLSVTPSRTLLFVPPGGKRSGDFLVRNTAAVKISVKSQTEEWTNLGSGVIGGAPSWLTVTASANNVPVGQERRFAWQVQLPAGAQGERMAQVYFEPASGSEQPETLHTRVGVLLVLIAQGTESKSVSLSGVALAAGTPPGGGTIELTLRNSGNVQLKWEASIDLRTVDDEPAGHAAMTGAKTLLVGQTQTQRAVVNDYVAPTASGMVASVDVRFGLQSPDEAAVAFTMPVLVTIAP